MSQSIPLTRKKRNPAIPIRLSQGVALRSGDGAESGIGEGVGV